MRIPTSVIVMSLLTAAPFSLAIRDTLKNKPLVTDDELDLDDLERSSARHDREALAEYEAEAARDAEEQSRKSAEKLAQLDLLFGKQSAMLGSMFGGAQIGSPATDALIAELDVVMRDGFILPSVNTSGDVVQSVMIQVVGAEYDPVTDERIEGCEMLREKLARAWGPSAGGTWANASTHTRASLTDSPCLLTFERYLEAADWLAALPLDMIGQSAARLAAKAGPDPEVTEDDISWSIPGTGFGHRMTDLYAGVIGGKVTGIRVDTDTDYDNLLAIRDALSAKLKTQPTRDEDSGAWVWRKKPGFTLVQDLDTDRFVLQIGKDPYQ